ncbi:Myosin head domain containing protein, partial [Asbolus verrucosus]
EFRLIHYAGAVTYNIKGFLEKNNDLLFRDLRETMSNSSNSIIKSNFPKEEQKSKKRPETAITQFKNSVNNLMNILMDKEPSYIRCIKPNSDKKSGVFDEELVRHQVTYLGLMENLRVRRAGFAYRREYSLFLQRYKSLSDQTWPKYYGDAKEGVQILNLLKRTWPPCPHVCIDGSKHLERIYGAHLSRIYRLKLSPEREAHLRLKVLAEKLFKDKKKSYQASIPQPFKTNRVSESAAVKQNYVEHLNGEKELYTSTVMKYDRHGYKPRERVILITSKNLHLIEVKNSVKLKHCLPLSRLNFLVTPNNDKMLLVCIPEDLMKKNKGDLILEVPHLIEAVTQIINITKNSDMLTIIDKSAIEHSMKQGKRGTIEIVVGNPERIHKDKSGHLLIIFTT